MGRPSWVHGHSTKHTTRHIPGNAMCVQNFDDSEIVQFILHIAFRCVLHRCRSQEIHCWKLYYISNDRDRGTGIRGWLDHARYPIPRLSPLISGLFFVSSFCSGVGGSARTSLLSLAYTRRGSTSVKKVFVYHSFAGGDISVTAR